jgi:hypothetical protein
MTVAASTACARPQGDKPLRWIINGPALATFASDPTSVRFFAGAKPFVIQTRENPVSLPASWRSILVRVFPSYAEMKRAFESGSVQKDVGAILYDNEVWQFTPPEEQRNFAEYNDKAAELVHEHGLLFISTPAVNLTRVLAPDSVGRRYDTFLSLGLARTAARHADVVDIQAQGSEIGVARYASFVRAAAAQARAANPNVEVLAGISTNPSGQRVSADVILRAIEATRDAVDGYWFNVPQPSAYCPSCNDFRPDMAIDVLHRLAAR